MSTAAHVNPVRLALLATLLLAIASRPSFQQSLSDEKFRTRDFLSTDRLHYQLIVADVDGDSLDDIVGSSGCSWWRNVDPDDLSASGWQFTDYDDFIPARTEGRTVALADVDASGSNDIVCGGYSEADPSTGFLGWFKDVSDNITEYSNITSNPTSFIVIEDFNGDGTLDIVAASPGGGVRFYVNINAGAPASSFEYVNFDGSELFKVSEIVVLDANEDTYMDVVMTVNFDTKASCLVLYLFEPDESAFSSPVTIHEFPATSHLGGLAVVELDYGNPLSLVVADETTGVFYFNKTSNSGTLWAGLTEIDVDSEGGAHKIAIADIDLGSRQDLLALRKSYNQLSWYENRGDTPYFSDINIVESYRGPDVARCFAVGDFDSDLVPDVVLAYGKYVVVYRNNPVPVSCESVWGAYDSAYQTVNGGVLDHVGGSSWRTALGSQNYSSGILRWSVYIHSIMGTYPMVGVTQTSITSSYLYSSVLDGYAINLDAVRSQGTEWLYNRDYHRTSAGDVNTVELNTRDGELRFYVNGNDLGVLYSTNATTYKLHEGGNWRFGVSTFNEMTGKISVIDCPDACAADDSCTPRETLAPTATPTAMSTDAPAPVSTDEPAPVLTDEPAPVLTDAPAPVSTDEPAPASTPASTQVPSLGPTSDPTRSPTGCGELRTNTRGDSQYAVKNILPGVDDPEVDFNMCCESCSRETNCSGFSFFPGNRSSTVRSCLLFDRYLDDETTVPLQLVDGWFSASLFRETNSPGDDIEAQGVLGQLWGENRTLTIVLATSFLTVVMLFVLSIYVERSVKKRMQNVPNQSPFGPASEVSGVHESQYTAPKGKHLQIILAGLALVDFVVDWLFVIERFNVEGTLTVEYEYVPLLPFVAGSFIVLPMLGNLLFIALLLRVEFYSTELRNWFAEHSAVGTLVALLALGNPEVLTLLISRTFGCFKKGSAFNAPFSDSGRQKISIAGLVGNLFEDIPQIVIQVIVMRAEETTTLITSIALASSVLTLAFGLMRRFFFLIMYCQQRRQDRDTAVEAANTANTEMARLRAHRASAPPMSGVLSAMSKNIESDDAPCTPERRQAPSHRLSTI